MLYASDGGEIAPFPFRENIGLSLFIVYEFLEPSIQERDAQPYFRANKIILSGKSPPLSVCVFPLSSYKRAERSRKEDKDCGKWKFFFFLSLKSGLRPMYARANGSSFTLLAILNDLDPCKIGLAT